MTSCVTVIDGIVTATDASPYTSGHLNTGGYFELTLDCRITSLTGTMLFEVFRIDSFGARTQQLFGGTYTPVTPPDVISPITIDIGPSLGYTSNFTFGNLVEVAITITGGSFSGIMCMQGKG